MKQKTLSLALQGGGSHGAFTWGVLDRLLAEDRIEIEAISATSAGAINGAVVLAGMAKGGRQEARDMLARFWWHVGEMAQWSPIQPTPMDRLTSGWGLSYSPLYQIVEALLRLMSPYQFNPLDINPLRSVLRTVVDFDALHKYDGLKLFVSATNVRSGAVRIFTNGEITEEVLMASAALANVSQAVEIDGEAYWDGGYVANPALYPLMRHCESGEVVVVQVTPGEVPKVPRSADDIMHRVNEISFNASLLREMHAIAYLTELHDRGLIDKAAGVKKTHMHLINDDQTMATLHASSKFNAERDFLTYLFEAGRTRADTWLNDHFDRIGTGSTIEVSEVYL